MKRKLVIGVCALLTLAAVLVFARKGGTRTATPSKSQLVVMPDGTIAGPRNDNITIVYTLPRPSTNALPTNAPAANK